MGRLNAEQNTSADCKFGWREREGGTRGKEVYTEKREVILTLQINLTKET